MLIAAKQACLDRIVGQLKEKEEEPEGEVLGDSDTGSLAYPLPPPIIFTDPIFIGIVCVGLLIILFFPAPSQTSQNKRRRREGHSHKRRRT